MRIKAQCNNAYGHSEVKIFENDKIPQTVIDLFNHFKPAEVILKYDSGYYENWTEIK